MHSPKTQRSQLINFYCSVWIEIKKILTEGVRVRINERLGKFEMVFNRFRRVFYAVQKAQRFTEVIEQTREHLRCGRT